MDGSKSWGWKKSAFSVRHLGSFYVEARVCLVMRFLIRLKRLNYIKWKYYRFRKKSSNGAIVINSKRSKVKRYRLFQYSDIFMTFKSHNWVQSFFIFFLLLKTSLHMKKPGQTVKSCWGKVQMKVMRKEQWKSTNVWRSFYDNLQASSVTLGSSVVACQWWGPDEWWWWWRRWVWLDVTLCNVMWW